MQLLINPYTSEPIAFSVKKEKRINLMQWERSLTSFDRRQAIKQVTRALNAWYYEVRDAMPSLLQ